MDEIKPMYVDDNSLQPTPSTPPSLDDWEVSVSVTGIINWWKNRKNPSPKQ